MSKHPTHRQIEILEFIHRFIKKNGWAPTYREIGQEFTIGPEGASHHLMAIERKGLILRKPNGYRCISITAKGMEALDAYTKSIQS